MARFQHEQVFRGPDAMTKIASAELLICGAGALGSNLAVNLCRSGFRKISVIDKDRVEEKNVGTQVYSLDDVGGKKADILRNIIFREVGEEISVQSVELTERNVGKVLKGAKLVVDAFDNTASRKLVYDFCREHSIACLHTGVNESYGEIRWNENYRVPSDAGLDVCDYPLARNLILMVVAVASEVLVNYFLNDEKRNYSITLGDLQINHEID
jgi:molybdopterin/thiamine biosynthesis adenylyltransferase